ncbi:MAG: hypothetical protein U1G07_23210 [Verrucomicrobiota bacterium]
MDEFRVSPATTNLRRRAPSSNLPVRPRWYRGQALAHGISIRRTDRHVEGETDPTADWPSVEASAIPSKTSAGSLLLLRRSRSLASRWLRSGPAAEQRKELLPKLSCLVRSARLYGPCPGRPSRWNAGKPTAWEPLRPELVVEVGFDHFTGGRFRHGTRLIRWRPDKAPQQCRIAQVSGAGKTAFQLL